MLPSLRSIVNRRLRHVNPSSLSAVSSLPGQFPGRVYSTNSSDARADPKPEPPAANEWALRAFLLGLAIPTLGWATDSYLRKAPASVVRSDSDAKHAQHGSAQDLQQGISELQAAFASQEGVVSVDPDVLHQHGFSVNDYHDGNIPFSSPSSPA